MKDIIVIKVQSFSDIVTNSSSELFVIKNHDDKFEMSAIKAILEDLVEVCRSASKYSDKGYLLSYNENLDDMLYVYEASGEPNSRLKEYYNVEYSRGDIIIESATDNSIPSIVMEFIQDWFGYDVCQRYHIG